MQSASAVLYCHLWSVWLYQIFPHYLKKRHGFRKSNVIAHKMCFDFLYKHRLKNVSFQEEFSEMTYMYISLHVMYLLFFSDFNQTWIFWTDFRKVIKHQISGKCVQWEPRCSMRTGVRRHEKSNSRFSQFCESTCERLDSIEIEGCNCRV
jgi:hypothetical protein